MVKKLAWGCPGKKSHTLNFGDGSSAKLVREELEMPREGVEGKSLGALRQKI
jgi:hypothetical protein